MTSCTWLSRRPAPLMRTKRVFCNNSGTVAPAISHAGLEAADHLVNDHRHRSAIGNPALDAFGDEFVQAVGLAVGRSGGGIAGSDALEVALARSLGHGA